MMKNTRPQHYIGLFLSLVLYVSYAKEPRPAMDSFFKYSTMLLFDHPQGVIANGEYLIQSDETPIIVAEGHILVSYGYYYAGQIDLALKNAYLAKIAAKKLDNFSIIRKADYLIHQIYSYYNLGNFKETISQVDFTPQSVRYLKANYLYHEKKYQQAKAILNLEGRRGNRDEELLLLKIKLKLTPSLATKQRITAWENSTDLGKYYKTNAYLLKADYSFQERAMDSSIYYNQKALILAKQLEHPYLINQVYQNLATLYLGTRNEKEFALYRAKYDSLYAKNLLVDKQINNIVFDNLTKEDVSEFNELEDKRTQQIIYLAMGLFLILTIYVVLLLRKKQKIQFYQTILTIKNQSGKIEKKNSLQKTKAELLPKDKGLLLLSKLEEFEQSTLYLSPHVSLGMVASELGTNTKYLSGLINSHKQKNFNTYINELRIQYILNKLMDDPTYLNYKISYLAEESGFSSHNSFIAAFKLYTGDTPTHFIHTLIQTKKLDL